MTALTLVTPIPSQARAVAPNPASAYGPLPAAAQAARVDHASKATLNAALKGAVQKLKKPPPASILKVKHSQDVGDSDIRQQPSFSKFNSLCKTEDKELITKINADRRDNENRELALEQASLPSQKSLTKNNSSGIPCVIL